MGHRRVRKEHTLRIHRVLAERWGKQGSWTVAKSTERTWGQLSLGPAGGGPDTKEGRWTVATGLHSSLYIDIPKKAQRSQARLNKASPCQAEDQGMDSGESNLDNGHWDHLSATGRRQPLATTHHYLIPVFVWWNNKNQGPRCSQARS